MDAAGAGPVEHGPLTSSVAPSAEAAAVEISAPPLLDAAPGYAARTRPDRPGRRSQATLTAWLVVWDALVPAALLVLAARFEGAVGPPLNGGAARVTDALVVVLAALSPIGLAAAGAYNQRRRRGGSRLLFALKLGVVGMIVSYSALIVSAAAGWPIDFAQMLALALLLPLGWLLGRWACDRHPATGAERVLLIGSGPVARRILDLTARHRERRLEVVGRLDADEEHDAPGGGPPVLGDLSDLPGVLRAHDIKRVIVAFAPGRDDELLDLLRHCVALGVQVDVVPRFPELVGATPHASVVGGLALMEVPGRGLSPGQRALKRGADVVGALLLLVLLLPVLAVAAASIAILDGCPVFFRQTRVGRAGAEFAILKLRTMPADGEAEGVARRATAAHGGDSGPDLDAPIGAVVRDMKTQGEERVTSLGALLRKSSFDEVPQLVNVLRGDMSLVGPRPLRPFEVASLNDWQLARQELRPGLTGLWQVLGRSDVDWDERMQLDYTYVSHWSFLTDLRILCRTVPAVLRKDGAV